MKFSLAICTHNHRAALQQTLAELKAINNPGGDWELLIVDNASSDGTREWLVQGAWQLNHIPCRSVQESALGVANARNRALHEAQGEYVVFLDDDETPEQDWLQQIEQIIDAHHPVAVGGRICAQLPGKRPDWLSDQLLGFLGELNYGPEMITLTKPSTPIFTGNAAFQRQTVLDAGGFDANLGRRGSLQSGGEDTDLYRRLIASGKTILWAPKAVIHHRIEPWKLCRRYFLQLHFHQGRMEGARKRGASSRIPPMYVFPQVARAYGRALFTRLRDGANHSLRLEMNAAYFTGYLLGWIKDAA